MKRFLNCALAVVMLLALTAPAYADIMWEPRSNHFYESHRQECEYNTRSYYANGSEGFVTLYDAPGGSLVEAQYENGELLWVGYTYQGKWALASYWQNGEETTGWVPMEDLSLKYDYLSFEEEYADRIKPDEDEFASYGGDAEAVNFYEYPGAPEIRESFETGSGHSMDILEILTGSGESSSSIRSIFVDEDGRTWGYVPYMYGIRNIWFCLDAPDGTDFPVREVSETTLISAREPVLPAVSYGPYVLVAAVVLATGGILAVFYGKRRKSTD